MGHRHAVCDVHDNNNSKDLLSPYGRKSVRDCFSTSRFGVPVMGSLFVKIKVFDYHVVGQSVFGIHFDVHLARRVIVYEPFLSKYSI